MLGIMQCWIFRTIAYEVFQGELRLSRRNAQWQQRRHARLLPGRGSQLKGKRTEVPLSEWWCPMPGTKVTLPWWRGVLEPWPQLLIAHPSSLCFLPFLFLSCQNLKLVIEFLICISGGHRFSWEPWKNPFHKKYTLAWICATAQKDPPARLQAEQLPVCLTLRSLPYPHPHPPPRLPHLFSNSSS